MPLQFREEQARRAADRLHRWGQAPTNFTLKPPKPTAKGSHLWELAQKRDEQYQSAGSRAAILDQDVSVDERGYDAATGHRSSLQPLGGGRAKFGKLALTAPAARRDEFTLSDRYYDVSSSTTTGAVGENMGGRLGESLARRLPASHWLQKVKRGTKSRVKR